MKQNRSLDFTTLLEIFCKYNGIKLQAPLGPVFVLNERVRYMVRVVNTRYQLTYTNSLTIGLKCFVQKVAAFNAL